MPLFRRKSWDAPGEAAAGEDVDPAAPPAAGDEEDAISGLPPADAPGAIGEDVDRPQDQPLGSPPAEEDLPPADVPAATIAPEEPAADVAPEELRPEELPPEVIDSSAERPAELDESEPLAADEEPLAGDEEPLPVDEEPLEPAVPGPGATEPPPRATVNALGDPPPDPAPPAQTESAVGSAGAAAGAASAAGVPPPPPSSPAPVRTGPPPGLETEGVPGEPAVSAAPVAGGLLEQRPEIAVLGAFAGGLLLARILKRLGRG
jgi:hypothetical protein